MNIENYRPRSTKLSCCYILFFSRFCELRFFFSRINYHIYIFKLINKFVIVITLITRWIYYYILLIFQLEYINSNEKKSGFKDLFAIKVLSNYLARGICFGNVRKRFKFKCNDPLHNLSK